MVVKLISFCLNISENFQDFHKILQKAFFFWNVCPVSAKTKISFFFNLAVFLSFLETIFYNVVRSKKCEKKPWLESLWVLVLWIFEFLRFCPIVFNHVTQAGSWLVGGWRSSPGPTDRPAPPRRKPIHKNTDKRESSNLEKQHFSLQGAHFHGGKSRLKIQSEFCHVLSLNLH